MAVFLCIHQKCRKRWTSLLKNILVDVRIFLKDVSLRLYCQLLFGVHRLVVIGAIHLAVCFMHFINPSGWHHKVDLAALSQFQYQLVNFSPGSWHILFSSQVRELSLLEDFSHESLNKCTRLRLLSHRCQMKDLDLEIAHETFWLVWKMYTLVYITVSQHKLVTSLN